MPIVKICGNTNDLETGLQDVVTALQNGVLATKIYGFKFKAVVVVSDLSALVIRLPLTYDLEEFHRTQVDYFQSWLSTANKCTGLSTVLQDYYEISIVCDQSDLSYWNNLANNYLSAQYVISY